MSQAKPVRTGLGVINSSVSNMIVIGGSAASRIQRPTQAVSLNSNTGVLQDVTNKVCNYSSSQPVQPVKVRFIPKVVPANYPNGFKFPTAVNPTTLLKTQVSNTVSPVVPSSLKFQSNALSATLPKIVARQDDSCPNIEPVKQPIFKVVLASNPNSHKLPTAVNPTALLKTQVSNTVSPAVPSSLKFQSNALSATLPKIVARQDDSCPNIEPVKQPIFKAVLASNPNSHKLPTAVNPTALLKTQVYCPTQHGVSSTPTLGTQNALPTAPKTFSAPLTRKSLSLCGITTGNKRARTDPLLTATILKMTNTHADLKNKANVVSENGSCAKHIPADGGVDQSSQELGVVHQSSAESEVRKILPTQGYNYQIEKIEDYKSPTDFIAFVRVNIETKDAALKWLRDFETCTMTNFRFENGKENTPKVVYKKRLRCHNNTRASEASSKTKVAHKKHVNCPSVICITIKNKNMPRSSDKYLQEYPSVIYIKHKHNHRIKCADALRFRRPYTDMKEHFISLFHKGHSPSSALHMIKHDLQEEYGLDYYKVAADGSRCPSVQWAYNVYYRQFSKEYGSPDGEEMLKSLQKFIDNYNTSMKEQCAKLAMLNDQYIVAIASPLMKRVLTNLKSTGEIMFVDSSGCMDRHNSRVFLMLAPSVAGALPVGVLLLSSEKENCVEKGLELHRDIIPEDSFVGRGRSAGPKIIMSDDCTPERNAFRSFFQSIMLLLCIFHVLQAFWRYIWDKNHGVALVERPFIMNMFKAAAYATSEEEFKANFQTLLEYPTVSSNNVLTKHLKEDLLPRATEWAMCYRKGLITRGHKTNNYSEANIKVIKDIILNRLKAFSVVQLFDFMTTKLDAYFERRIADVINNRVSNYTRSRYFVEEKKLVPLSCEKVTEHMYLVKNSEKGTEYMVDSQVELCTCPMGNEGAMCKHIYKVVKTYNISSEQVLPFADSKSKLALHFIMTGQQGNEEFFKSLRLNPGEESRDDVDDEVHAEINDEANVHGEINGEGASNDMSSEAESDPPGMEPVEPTELTEQTEPTTPCAEKLEKFMDSLKERSKTNPALGTLVNKFVDRYFEECQSDSSLEHALATFNRYRGQKPSQQHTVSRNIRYSSRIPIQITAPGRRSMPISGRHSRITGRPPKSFRVEHQYSQHPAQPSWMGPANKRSRAPQNLAQCVSSNVPLGRNCNRKM